MTSLLKRPLVQLGLLAIVCFVGGLMLGGYHGSNDSHLTERDVLIFLAAMLLLSIAITPLYMRYWRNLDELAQRAHFSAWLFGGQYGMLVSALFALVLYLFAPDVIPTAWREASFALGFAGGVVVIVYGGIFGYLVAWALFWFKQR